MTSAIDTFLTRLGLSEKDQKIYYTIIRLGIARASEIARATHLPRQTIYSILQTLLHLKLIDQHDKRGIKQFSTNPRKLIERLHEEREDLLEEQQAIEKELPKLEALKYRTASVPKITYYEGKEGMKHLLKDILHQHRKGVTEFRGYGINHFQKTLGEDLYTFVKKRSSYGVQTKLMIAQGDDDFGITNEKDAHGRSIKRLAIPQQRAGFYLVGDRVYLFSYLDGIGVVIENEAIVKLLQDVFDNHWNHARF